MRTLKGFNKDPNATCLENIFLALIYYMDPENLSHIYSYCWDFGYLEKGKSELGLSERLSNTKDRTIQQRLLKQYHGISIRWSENYIPMKIMPEEFPYIVCMDSFCCSWNIAYQSAHIPHYFFLKKKEGDYFIYDDPYFNLSDQVLSIKDLKQGLIRTGKASKKPFLEFNPLKEFINSVKYVIEGYQGKGDCHQIELFAEEIKNDNDLQQYLIRETDLPANSKILITLNHIARGRLKYYMYWNNYADNDAICSLIKELRDIYAMWNVTVKLLIRLFFDKNEKNIRKSIYEQLIAIANAEKKAGLETLGKCNLLF